MAKQTLFLSTIGHLSQTLQTPIGEVRRALDRLGAKPALVINGLEHYDESALVRRGRQRPQPKARNSKQ
jgi:hypothetical protein